MTTTKAVTSRQPQAETSLSSNAEDGRENIALDSDAADSADSPPGNAGAFIGRGRAAEVYLEISDHDGGGARVRKVFTGETVSGIVLGVLTGAGNPYTWCESAIQCAVARRNILNVLVRFWFGDDALRVVETFDYKWDEEHLAFAIRSRFVDGYHAPLKGADDEHPDADGMHDLVHRIQKPLQQHLQDAGFDGLVWQAGKGNPLGAANFMIDANRVTDTQPCPWVWIDLESGVPALFAVNPLATLGYYIPKCLKHRRLLFDDVDVQTLQRYLDQHQIEICAANNLDADGWQTLEQQVRVLTAQQDKWKSIPRHARGIENERAQMRITAAQAEWYQQRPLRWSVRYAGVRAVGLLAKVAKKSKRLARFLTPHLLWRVMTLGTRFAFMQRYRQHVAWHVVGRRIRSWKNRRQISTLQARELRQLLRADEAAVYMTDFGVHVAIKPAVKIFQYGILPALLAAGLLTPPVAAFLLLTGGLFARTGYTLGRIIQNAILGRPRPWVALVVGVFPVAGNAAFPIQLLYCGSAESGKLARFIIHDVVSGFGRAIPIWGGADSVTEHLANRVGNAITRLIAWRRTPISDAIPANEQEAIPEIVVRSDAVARSADAIRHNKSAIESD